jgi:hypothetical protein
MGVMCAGKRRFASAEEARRANSGQRPYPCPFCLKFHLTSKSERPRRRRKGEAW